LIVISRISLSICLSQRIRWRGGITMTKNLCPVTLGSPGAKSTQ
jgi:hypothetical protein